MSMKWIGTAFILVGCGSFGFRMVLSCRRQTKELRQLVEILDMLSAELRCRLTPLPELCLLASKSGSGSVGLLFRKLHGELVRQIAPDAACCMNAALSNTNLSPTTKMILRNLGRGLGCFDLEGQLQGIHSVRQEAEQALTRLTDGQEARLRSYQTLGLCAGAALAILLL